jgi:hypothetical protein
LLCKEVTGFLVSLRPPVPTPLQNSLSTIRIQHTGGLYAVEFRPDCD